MTHVNNNNTVSQRIWLAWMKRHNFGMMKFISYHIFFPTAIFAYKEFQEENTIV